MTPITAIKQSGGYRSDSRISSRHSSCSVALLFRVIACYLSITYA